jgi:hypothetical protein
MIAQFKRGDTPDIPAVNFTKGGQPVDLSDVDVTVTCQLRPSLGSATVVVPDIDLTKLPESIIQLSLTPDVTRTMQPGVWVGDIEVTIPAFGTKSSETFELEVIADVTVPVVAP